MSREFTALRLIFYNGDRNDVLWMLVLRVMMIRSRHTSESGLQLCIQWRHPEDFSKVTISDDNEDITWLWVMVQRLQWEHHILMVDGSMITMRTSHSYGWWFKDYNENITFLWVMVQRLQWGHHILMGDGSKITMRTSHSYGWWFKD